MVKVSQILESILAQLAFDLERSGQNYRTKDFLALAILSRSATKAVRSLNDIYTKAQFSDIKGYIERGLAVEQSKGSGAAAFLSHYRRYLCHKHRGDGFISTIDVITDILEDKTTLLYQALSGSLLAEKEYYEGM